MQGDEWQKHANLRALYTYMYTHPGNKLLFMGGEFGQTHEWDFSQSLDWHLLQYPIHQGLQNFVKNLNTVFKSEKHFTKIISIHTVLNGLKQMIQIILSMFF